MDFKLGHYQLLPATPESNQFPSGTRSERIPAGDSVTLSGIAVLRVLTASTC
jgi:hypothetical protein